MMFKGKSPIGKENTRNQWLHNDQHKNPPLSPIKHTPSFQHTFAKARFTREAFDSRLPPTLGKAVSNPDHLNLECDETLQVCSTEERQQKNVGFNNDLLCEEQLSPRVAAQNSELTDYLYRVRGVMERYNEQNRVLKDQVRQEKEMNRYLMEEVNRMKNLMRR